MKRWRSFVDRVYWATSPTLLALVGAIHFRSDRVAAVYFWVCAAAGVPLAIQFWLRSKRDGWDLP